MNIFSCTTIASILVACGLAGCVTTSQYAIEQVKAAKELPAYEQAFKNENCFNLRFKFINKMSFGRDDALNSLKCLELERTRNELRAKANGTIDIDELTASNAYENNRAIFTYLANGEIQLTKARELYSYVAEKSKNDAFAEMTRSNQLLAQGQENQRRAWEQENRNRAIFLQSMIESNTRRTPIVTTCNLNTVTNTVTCTTQ